MVFFQSTLQAKGVIKKKCIMEKWLNKELVRSTGNGIATEGQTTEIVNKAYLLVIAIDGKETTAMVSENDYIRAIVNNKAEVKYIIKNRKIKITKVII